ncbi:MAG: cytochrome c biogenesis protein DipZ [Pseudomonadota bacterium]
MILFILAYLGGVLTILSPCILPILPFVFARAGQPFLKSTLPMLLSMALCFSLIGFLGAIGGHWVIQANQLGRWFALALLFLFSLTLLSKSLAEALSRPFVALGNLLTERFSENSGLSGSNKQADTTHSLLSSVAIGAATGLLWAPCAGPILGLILTGAALNGASAKTAFLLLAYAAGAMSAIALALTAGKPVFNRLKKSLGASEWVRKALGVVMLLGVCAIALGWDITVLTQISSANTFSVEQKILSWGMPRSAAIKDNSPKPKADTTSPTPSVLPRLEAAEAWLNTAPLTVEALKGKVVLVDFWTYSCINCIRTLPYLKAWADKYQKQGLIVIGVHTPEFAFERDLDNVKREVKKLDIQYPVAIDNRYAIWKAFNNEYWPAHYFIDAKGVVRDQHFGEGGYEASEAILKRLLAEANHEEGANHAVKENKPSLTPPSSQSVFALPDEKNIASPETYLGYQRAAHYVSDLMEPDDVYSYRVDKKLRLNDWGLKGQWLVNAEKAIAQKSGASIVYRFRARDLHLVMGTAKSNSVERKESIDNKGIKFRVRLDGAAPKVNKGLDINEAGEGKVVEQRLYQLIRQKDTVQEHTFEIEFLEPGVEVYAFTFG